MYKEAYGTEEKVTAGQLISILKENKGKQVEICGCNGIAIIENEDYLAFEIYDNMFQFDDLRVKELADTMFYRDITTDKLIEILEKNIEKNIEIAGEDGLIALVNDKIVSIDFFSSVHSDEALQTIEKDNIYKIA